VPPPAIPNAAKAAENGDGAASRPTMQPASTAEPQSTTSTALQQQVTAMQTITCPVCAFVNRPGVLICDQCGYVLTSGANRETHLLNEGEDVVNPQGKYQTGEVIVADQKPIVLEINGRELSIPLADLVTIGRISDTPAHSHPDIDLTPYGAEQYGVSRVHCRIKRRSTLLYVTDLGSTNGTFLNGRRLLAHAERLLRNGDELMLGRLKTIVRF
jgi:hypothetical protein